MSDDFERMWSDLAPVGRSASSGGYFRQPFLSAERELAAWFAEQAAARGLEVETDGFGNQVAWWDPPGGALGLSGRTGRTGREGALLTGSHLDSVLDGGAYDGPLGVVSALAAVDLMRERGVVPTRSVGVAVFVEEEGSRFGLACLGSRLAIGALSWEAGRELVDRDGVRLGDVIDGGAGAGWLAAVSTYVELHVEQGRDLVDRNAAIGVASGIWPHGRYRFDLTGEANHAGTTRMEDRADPMLTYAMTALAANKQARLTGAEGGRATFGRVEVAPNGTNAVPSRVTAWLDARCESDEALADLVASIERQAVERAGRDGTSVTVTAESVSGAVSFDAALAEAIATDHSGGDWPVIATQAGHDAGILAAAGVPERDALRAQPDRGLAQPGGDRVDGRLPGRRLGAGRHVDATGRVSAAVTRDGVPARAGVGRRRGRRRRAGGDRRRSVQLVRHSRRGGGPKLPLLGRSFSQEREFLRFSGETATRLPGLTLPGLANAHSHAFHRALRGRTQHGVRHVLDVARADVRRGRSASTRTPTTRWPARRTPRWSPPAYTSVGEFHYLHHRPGGTPYDDPNAMGHALVAAARDAGIRIVLLDTCYLSSGFGRPVEAAQLCYSDRSAALWAARTARLWGDDTAGTGRSDPLGPRRARPTSWPRSSRRLPADRCTSTCPSSRPRTTPAWRRTACTPTRLLADHGALGPRTTRRARHPPHRRRRRAARQHPHPRLPHARPPSATSPTASDPPAACTTPAAGSASAATATR